MLTDQHIGAWARVLTGYCTEVQPGQTVIIQGDTAAEPLLRAIFREVVASGGLPVMLPVFSGLQADLLMAGNDEQLQFISSIERFAREEADVSIRVMAESNTRSASAVDPGRNSAWARPRAELSQRFMQRAADGDLRWTLTLFPTPAYAQDAGMNSADYAEFIYAACKLDQPDPVAAWTDLHREQARLIEWLSSRKVLRILGPGTDLTVTIAGRRWINSDGKRNFPSGEVFTGPVENSANGVITCSFPVMTKGQAISGVRLVFEDGVVVEASAEQNEAFLHAALDTDDGARRLGEVAIGTNFGIDRFTGQILLDEKIGGTAHVALGSGYPETGSTNRSAIHWDLISDLRRGGRIEGDGEALMIDGRFVI